ncbi:MAG: pilus assembly protein PilN [Gammaproteobacteria bacterium]|nr:MAG: pilus assembly protein PilN [Gammaproteobacteria bacterium]
MPHVNLLPWREERRKERQRQFLSLLLLAVVATAAVFGLMTFQMNQVIGYQQARNGYLDREILILDKKIAEIKRLEATKARLLARKEIIDQLQANRSQMVHLFDELVKTLPEGVYLTTIQQNGQLLMLGGVAESSARVAAYLRNLDASTWLHDPWLEQIQATETNTTRVQNFSLRVSLIPRTLEEDVRSGM